MFLRSLYGTVSGFVSSLETITAGQWYTIVAWHDSVNNMLNIQVNNGTVSGASYASGAIDSSYPLSIGAHSDGYTAFDGRIDEVVLYKRVLAVNERAWMYNNEIGRAYADLTTSNPGTTNLVSWWSMNETSGTRNDSYGTNSLTDNNTVSYAAGLQGNAASFITANHEFLSRADNAALSTGDINFTLVASVYLNNTSNIMIIANKGLASSSIRDYLLFYNPTGSKFSFSVGNGTVTGSVASLETITAGRWYTIVAWHDAVNNTLNIQVNNGTVSSVSYASGAMDTTYPLSIGSHADGSYGVDGRIDEVAFYKRVLTAAERSWLYNSGAGRSYADLSTPRTITTYAYGNTAHKHAVTSLSTGESYTYDANGNMITRVEGGLTYTQTFDAENRLISVTVSGQTTQFVYDGDGNLVKKIKPDGSKTLYVGGIYEVDKNSGGTVTGTKTYYPAAGAMRINSTLYYVLKDHLGSASVVTDASGNTIPGADTRYYPFGEARFSTSQMLTDKLFTSQREITGLGIYYYGARFYSPKLGRFLSADTIVPGYRNPQNFNRFSYVLNNPLRYTDPTGHMFDEGCSTGCGGTIDYKLFPCADTYGLVRDICLRGPKKPKTMREIVKDIDEFFGISMVVETCKNPYAGCGPVFLAPAFNIEQNIAEAWETIDSTISAIIDVLDSAPETPWLTPTVTPSPFLSPTAEPTPTITRTPGPTLTASLTMTPSPTSTPPTQPTRTPTPILTPVYRLP